jgi:sugar phosphate isomerase/epimerase
MVKSCVTISLVDEARGGPFVFWDDFRGACRQAAELGFDAVELFPPSAEAASALGVRDILDALGLGLAAVGTGAGWVRQGLSLTDADADQRARAMEFVRSMIDLAGSLGAAAIIGSMQGRWTDTVQRTTALDYLRAALDELGQHARQYGRPLIYEPLNRYETNLCNTLDQGQQLLASLATDNVLLLADLFHMNIEEVDIATALRHGGRRIGHVHFVDSNRRPAGCGHLDFAPIADALRDIGYRGYVSAEAFPYPDSTAAARQTIDSYREYFRQ